MYVRNKITLFFIIFSFHLYASETYKGSIQMIGVIKKIDLKNKTYIIQTNDKKNYRVAHDDLELGADYSKINAGDAVLFNKHKDMP